MSTIHQVTPPEGLRLGGDGPQLARQFTAGVLHPLMARVESHQGTAEVLRFQSCLLMQVCIDLQAIYGEATVQAILQTVREQLASSTTAVKGH